MELFLFLVLIPYTSLASTGHKFIIWDKKEIKVCWHGNFPTPNQSFTESQLKEIEVLGKFIPLDEQTKTLIAQTIQNEYTEKKTGIHFNGWGNCERNDSSDVFILIGSNDFSESTSQGSASLGLADSDDIQKLRTPDKKAFVFIDVSMWDPDAKWSREDYIKSTSLHEFGHIAGLRHEHIRSMGGEKWDEALFFSVYDSLSIMNYLFFSELEENGTEKIGGEVKLSPLDIHGLRCLYIYSEETFKSICHSDYKLE